MHHYRRVGLHASPLRSAVRVASPHKSDTNPLARVSNHGACCDEICLELTCSPQLGLNPAWASTLRTQGAA